jgi:hypothetical protein
VVTAIPVTEIVLGSSVVYDGSGQRHFFNIGKVRRMTCRVGDVPCHAH